MRLLIALCCWSLASLLHAAPLRVEALGTPKQPDREANRFPWVRGGPEQAAVVARINTLLFVRDLEVLPPLKAADGLREVSEQFWRSASNFSYKVLRNDERLLSLAVDAEGCGAYCESFTVYHAFDVATGRHLGIDDLLTPAGQQALAQRLHRERSARLRQAIAQLRKDLKRPPKGDATRDDIDGAIGLYRACLQERSAPADRHIERLGRMRLDARALGFVAGRCSNHAMRALDDLDEFDNRVPFDQLDPWLTAYGQRLLRGNGTDAAPPALKPFGQALRGRIDGRLPVTLLLDEPEPDGSVRGSYFYDRFRKRIELYGRLDGNALTLEEQESTDSPAPRIEARVRGSGFEGEWIGAGKRLRFDAAP